jgi:hypothetical protein
MLFILLNNQSHAALSSRIYYSLRDYSICFGAFCTHHQEYIKIVDADTSHVSV